MAPRRAGVWRADGAGEPLVLRGHEGGIWAASFSPDGTRVASAGLDGTVRLWRADGAGEPLVLRGHEGPVSAASFSPDGTRVASAGRDGTVRLWRYPASDRRLLEFAHASVPHDMAGPTWSPIPRRLTPAQRGLFFLEDAEAALADAALTR